MGEVKKSIDALAIILDMGPMLENSAVLQTQVGDQLIALRSMGIRSGLLAVSADRARFDEVIGNRLRTAGVEVTLIPDRGFVRNLVGLAWALRRLRSRFEVRHGYVRGLWSPLLITLANPFRSLPYVYDVRGDVADETAAAGTNQLKRRFYLALEAWGIRRAGRVSAVTRYLAESTASRHRLTRVEVVPSCVDVKAFDISEVETDACRKELGFSKSGIVFVYSGGLNRYQHVPAMLALWRRFLAESDVEFLLLTSDAPHARSEVVGHLSEFGKRLRHRSEPRDRVPLMLGASTIGFMLRDTREQNRAASPVKFAEYLAAGLAVVASPGTGDASDRVTAMRLGALVDPLDLDSGEVSVRALLDETRTDRANLRGRTRTAARSHYDWRAYEPIYRSMYSA